MSIRVLHLIPTMRGGGAERQISILLPQIQANNLDVTLCFHTEGQNLITLQNQHVPYLKYPTRTNYDPRLLADTFRFAKAFQPDIIQTWLPQMDVLGGLVARLTGIPHVLSERSSGASYTSREWKNRLRVAIGKKAEVIIANSEGGLQYWRAQGARGRLHVVRNALTPSSLEPAPLSQFGLDSCRLLMAAGRLSKLKNVAVLVQAMATALLKLPEHHAVIFGVGPERENALAVINQFGLEQRMHLFGYTQNLDGWLRASEVFISASLVEGHPNVVIEAAAAGCPLVLSDIPAHREFAVGNSALFAPAQDAARLAEAVVQSVMDRSAALTRAVQARVLTESLSIEAAALQYARIYRSMLNQDKLVK